MRDKSWFSWDFFEGIRGGWRVWFSGCGVLLVLQRRDPWKGRGEVTIGIHKHSSMDHGNHENEERTTKMKSKQGLKSRK